MHQNIAYVSLVVLLLLLDNIHCDPEGWLTQHLTIKNARKIAEAALAPKTTTPDSQAGDSHLIFSTDCSSFHDWQALLLFHSAKTAGQAGKITRIASGCRDEKKQELRELYEKLHPEYSVHFTPNYKRSHLFDGVNKTCKPTNLKANLKFLMYELCKI